MASVELTVAGIALAPVIAALCEAAKTMGLPVKYVPALNAVLSVLAYALVVLVAERPDVLDGVVIVLNGIIVALSAAGFYSTVRFLGNKREGAAGG